MFPSQIPIIISVLFLISFTIPIVLIGFLVRKGVEDKDKKNTFRFVILFYVTYLFVVTLGSIDGFFDEILLPPKIVIFTTLPLSLFLIGYVFNTKLYKRIIKNLTLSSLVSVHIFRLIGSFFIVLLFLELLPKPFALIAGLGDIITAISSVFVAKAIRNKKTYAKKIALIWNTFGFVDILITSIMAILFTKWNIDTGSQGVEILAQFPFSFIPAFAPATIIFLHLSIYRKILNKKFQ